MENACKISSRDLNLYYGENHALKGIEMDIYEKQVTALIGPSGCGKSTFLKTLNRMNDLVPNVKITGKITLDGEDVYAKSVDVTLLRKKVGIVFQNPKMCIRDRSMSGVPVQAALAGTMLSYYFNPKNQNCK